MIYRACPLCGAEGPHPVVDDRDPARHVVTIECSDCHELATVEVD